MRHKFKKELLPVIVNFKEYLKYERQLADTTITGYVFFVSEFAEFVGKELNSVTRDDFRDFIKYLKAREIKSSSISNYIISLRQLYNWMAYIDKKEDLNELSFFLSKIMRIRRERVVPEVPTTSELDKLREVLQAYKNALSYNTSSEAYKIALRDSAIFEMLIATGARSFEIRRMKRCDVDLNNGAVLIRSGKGGHQRVAVFSKVAQETLKEHLSHSKLDAEARLFVIRNGNMLNYIIKRWAKRAGINTAIHSHSFRHYHITEAQRKGIPIQYVADQVGHVSYNTTRQYTHLDVESRREQYNNLNF